MRGINLGKKNGMWKDKNVGYASLHEWVNNKLIKPQNVQIVEKLKSLNCQILVENISVIYLIGDGSVVSVI